MAGGKFSFGSGGYFESPIDPLLETNRDIWILLPDGTTEPLIATSYNERTP